MKSVPPFLQLQTDGILITSFLDQQFFPLSVSTILRKLSEHVELEHILSLHKAEKLKLSTKGDFQIFVPTGNICTFIHFPAEVGTITQF